MSFKTYVCRNKLIRINYEKCYDSLTADYLGGERTVNYDALYL